MTMKLEVSDSQSNHSDFSNDSQSSQDSSANDCLLTVVATRNSRNLALANLEGLQSGVPTRTTATITPTQLRNLEQTYIELSCRSDQTNHAGFVPPSVTHASNYGILNPGGYCDGGPTTALHVSPGPYSASGDSSCSPGPPAPKRRNMGGRRPTKAPQDTTPEEEERRKVRRERNKMAAARCRKRRLDHTNELQDETDKLEERQRSLREEIEKLKADKGHLEAILDTHLCRLTKRSVSPPDVKPFQETYTSYAPDADDGVRVKVEVMDPSGEFTLEMAHNDVFTSPTADKRMLTGAMSTVNGGVQSALDTPPATTRPNRPSFLQICTNKNTNKIAGIDITTPSNGIPFNFDSLMEGGTGLTPVHPHPQPAHAIHGGHIVHGGLAVHGGLTVHGGHAMNGIHGHPACAQQQRSAPDVASPDGHLVSL